jgi:hypothetical protein
LKLRIKWHASFHFHVTWQGNLEEVVKFWNWSLLGETRGTLLLFPLNQRQHIHHHWNFIKRYFKNYFITRYNIRINFSWILINIKNQTFHYKCFTFISYHMVSNSMRHELFI